MTASGKGSPKNDYGLQGHVGSIGRRCIICGNRWDAPHPNDVNTMFCPDCLKTLKTRIEKDKEYQDKTV